MGQVYLARDTKLGRKVAIKFMSTLSERMTQRFLVEARATARCNHENIVVIHEVNAFQGLPYMVLEYLEGQPLSRWMSARRLPSAQAVELMVPIVRALVHAHELNIVHRDLKPDNVVVLDSGAIKVLDFGVARMIRETPTDEDANDCGEAATATTVQGPAAPTASPTRSSSGCSMRSRERTALYR